MTDEALNNDLHEQQTIIANLANNQTQNQVKLLNTSSVTNYLK